MLLSETQRGKSYEIVSVRGEEKFRRRLLDMGFAPGRKTVLKRVAPFGGTLLVAIGGAMIALRRDAAELLEVKEAAR